MLLANYAFPVSLKVFNIKSTAAEQDECNMEAQAEQ
jgi:hypothetical protein